MKKIYIRCNLVMEEVLGLSYILCIVFDLL